MANIGTWFYKTKDKDEDAIVTNAWEDADDLEGSHALVWDVDFVNQFIHRVNVRIAALDVLNPYITSHENIPYDFVDAAKIGLTIVQETTAQNLASRVLVIANTQLANGGWIEKDLTISSGTTEFSSAMLKSVSGLSGLSDEISEVQSWVSTKGKIISASLFISMRKILDATTRLGVEVADWTTNSAWRNNGTGQFGYKNVFSAGNTGNFTPNYFDVFSNSITNFPINWGREQQGDPFYNYTAWRANDPDDPYDKRPAVDNYSTTAGGFIRKDYSRSWSGNPNDDDWYYVSWTAYSGNFFLNKPYCPITLSAKMYSINTTTINDEDLVEDKIMRQIGSMSDTENSGLTMNSFACDPSASLVSLDLLGYFDYSWTTQTYLIVIEINDTSSPIPTLDLPIEEP